MVAPFDQLLWQVTIYGMCDCGQSRWDRHRLFRAILAMLALAYPKSSQL